MRRFRLRLTLALLFASVLAACGALNSGSDIDAAAVEQTSQALAAAALAGDQTATAAALVPAATPEPPTVEVVPPTELPPTATTSSMAMTLAAAGTQQAPTIAAGQTLAAQTQGAVPTTAPILIESLSIFTTESIIQNDVEITVTAVLPPPTSLAQAWSQVYAAPAGVPFTITTDEAAMALSITNAMAASGFGSNVSDLTVSLNNNLITVEFTVNVGGTSADGRVSFSAFAQNGQVVVTMTSLQFGRFTVPPDMLDALTVALAQAMTGTGDPAQAQVTITDLFIDDGQMIVSGVVGPPA